MWLCQTDWRRSITRREACCLGRLITTGLARDDGPVADDTGRIFGAALINSECTPDGDHESAEADSHRRPA